MYDCLEANVATDKGEYCVKRERVIKELPKDEVDYRDGFFPALNRFIIDAIKGPKSYRQMQKEQAEENKRQKIKENAYTLFIQQLMNEGWETITSDKFGNITMMRRIKKET